MTQDRLSSLRVCRFAVNDVTAGGNGVNFPVQDGLDLRQMRLFHKVSLPEDPGGKHEKVGSAAPGGRHRQC